MPLLVDYVSQAHLEWVQRELEEAAQRMVQEWITAWVAKMAETSVAAGSCPGCYWMDQSLYYTHDEEDFERVVQELTALHDRENPMCLNSPVVV